ncbi:selenoprotein H-like [Dreissena polymorpha]|uniref:selenoprotein H-like n=1 Tax=Dreissena polymorpha TaxID=45954 RepID=UPI002264EF28|nr:selenoprotein H-like [Dreissena polymorpha]
MPGRTAQKRLSASKTEPSAAETSPKKMKETKVFKRKASDLVEALREEFGEFEVEYNPSAPRKGSFEVVVQQSGKDDVTIWTGLKKGPPRKLKFPEVEEVVKEMKQAGL